MTVQTGFRPKWQKAAHQDKPSRFQGPSEPQQASWSIPNHGFGDLQTKIMHSVHSPAGVTKTLMTAQAISTVSAFPSGYFWPTYCRQWDSPAMEGRCDIRKVSWLVAGQGARSY
jgi:hypothetical protein